MRRCRTCMLRHGTDVVHSTRVAAPRARALRRARRGRGDRGRRPRTGACWRRRRCCTTSAAASAYDNRHKHARYLILDEGLPGFTREDMVTVAQIVRYIPKGTPEADTRVELLAGVLRIAEQLERTRRPTSRASRSWRARRRWRSLVDARRRARPSASGRRSRRPSCSPTRWAGSSRSRLPTDGGLAPDLSRRRAHQQLAWVRMGIPPTADSLVIEVAVLGRSPTPGT